MTLQLIIARHANTFESGETPRRVGARTDLNLTSRGREQSSQLGRALASRFGQIETIYAAPLLRTKQTADIAASEMPSPPSIETLDFLREIDHGPDENKSDADIAARLGPQALALWDEELIMPDDWSPRPLDIVKSWKLFLHHIAQQTDSGQTAPQKTILVVTSNGIARFAPLAALCPIETLDDHTIPSHPNGVHGNPSLASLLSQLSLPSLKLATAAYGVMSYNDTKWTLIDWNKRPS